MLCKPKEFGREYKKQTFPLECAENRFGQTPSNYCTSAPDTSRPHTTPGTYVTTTPPLWEQYARAKPWVLKSADQFRPGPPPARRLVAVRRRARYAAGGGGGFGGLGGSMGRPIPGYGASLFWIRLLPVWGRSGPGMIPVPRAAGARP